MASITPVKASFHYDDVTQTWEMKISRGLRDGTGNYAEKPIIEKAATFLQLLTLLYQFWAMFSQDVAADKRNSPFEDKGEFQAWLTSANAHDVELVAPPEGTAPLDAPDMSEYEDYTGGEDDWGATPP